jgi:hypothetical protein
MLRPLSVTFQRERGAGKWTLQACISSGVLARVSEAALREVLVAAAEDALMIVRQGLGAGAGAGEQNGGGPSREVGEDFVDACDLRAAAQEMGSGLAAELRRRAGLAGN